MPDDIVRNRHDRQGTVLTIGLLMAAASIISVLHVVFLRGTPPNTITLHAVLYMTSVAVLLMLVTVALTIVVWLDQSALEFPHFAPLARQRIRRFWRGVLVVSLVVLIGTLLIGAIDGTADWKHVPLLLIMMTWVTLAAYGTVLSLHMLFILRRPKSTQ